MPSLADRMTAAVFQPPTANASAEERPASLHDALEALERASNTKPKQRAVNLPGAVHVICRHAFEHGLDQSSLRGLVHVASVKTELDQTSVTTLIKNLYPSQRVPADVVVTIVGALGQGKGKPTPATQNSFVKWLITVHEIIEDPTVLSRLYSVLFGLLDSISIRLEYARGLGNEPALQGLLRVYKDYYPDIILGSTSASRNSFPPAPDAEWRSRIAAIQERAAAEDAGSEQRNGFKASVTLEGIDNVEDFIEKLDRIELPGQMISFLTDPLLQKYVELTSSPIISQRIQLWLQSCLKDQYNATVEGVVETHFLSDILDGLLKHAQYTKTLLPVIALLHPNTTFCGQVASISAWFMCSLTPTDARVTYFQPVERALLDHGPLSYEHLLGFYVSLYRQWTNRVTPQPSRYGSALGHPDQRALAHPVPIHKHYPEEMTMSFNSIMRDFYNLTWLSRGLVAEPPKCVGLLCEPALRDDLQDYLAELDQEYNINVALNITHNPLLASLSLAAWLEVENEEIDKEGYDPEAIQRHAGPVGQISLEKLRARGGVHVEWEAYRVRVLKWLEERGLGGPKAFMFAASVPLRTKYGDRV
ncbi:hypothetical protein GRF29_1g1314434 [Pseudopithomyces chartarum]|uniref:Mis6-domain-containing protein n=1 Tax=Pseudopithomyces chartarum TaxID=1892770 RepID=A0AAN6M5P8_9PLEO|nr:hypothetical protein GRF29_1g1314434 [Pseudopithomyces chartarum]